MQHILFIGIDIWIWVCIFNKFESTGKMGRYYSVTWVLNCAPTLIIYYDASSLIILVDQHKCEWIYHPQPKYIKQMKYIFYSQNNIISKLSIFYPISPFLEARKGKNPVGQPRIRHSIKSHPYKANSAFKTMPLGHTCMMYLPSLYVKFIIIIIDINYNFDTLGFSHLLFSFFYF